MIDLLARYEWLFLIVVSIAGAIFGISIVAVIVHLRRGQNRKNIKENDSNEHPKPTKEHQRNSFHNDRLIEVYKQLTTLTSTLSYQRVLDFVLDLGTGALSSPDDMIDELVGAVLLFSENGTSEPLLHVASSRRLAHSDLRDTFPAREGILKAAIDEGVALITHRIASDPELKRLLALQNCNAAYCFPLRHGLDTYGVILHSHPNINFFTPERLEILDLIGNQAMVAIQNARLYKDLDQEKERMMEIQEEARKKLARDLHDGPTQSVAAIAMRISFARRLFKQDAEAAIDELDKIENLARRTTKEIRHMLFTLRPLILESQGLEAALGSMAEKLKETFGQILILDIEEGIEEELEMGKQGVLFAIIEEAVNNARKYANADHIWVRMFPIQDEIIALEIEDDGVGFSVEEIDSDYENSGSLGLINMRERSELVNGVISIDSRINNGTLIKLIFPLSEEANERLRRIG